MCPWIWTRTSNLQPQQPEQKTPTKRDLALAVLHRCCTTTASAMEQTMLAELPDPAWTCTATCSSRSPAKTWSSYESTRLWISRMIPMLPARDSSMFIVNSSLIDSLTPISLFTFLCLWVHHASPHTSLHFWNRPSLFSDLKASVDYLRANAYGPGCVRFRRGTGRRDG